MNIQQQPPPQMFQFQQLPPLPFPFSPHDRFPFWRKLFSIVAICTFITSAAGLKAIPNEKLRSPDLPTIAMFVCIGLFLGTVGGLIWVGVDYLEFRNRRGLKTSPIFAHLFCMGGTSAIIWFLILAPISLVAAFAFTMMGVL